MSTLPILLVALVVASLVMVFWGEKPKVKVIAEFGGVAFAIVLVIEVVRLIITAIRT